MLSAFLRRRLRCTSIFDRDKTCRQDNVTMVGLITNPMLFNLSEVCITMIYFSRLTRRFDLQSCNAI